MYGGKGATPALKVESIPAGANAIIVEYNDLSYSPLASDGGRGNTYVADVKAVYKAAREGEENRLLAVRPGKNLLNVFDE